jgi:hypothetical protein
MDSGQFYSETGKLKSNLFNDMEEELTHKKVTLSRGKNARHTASHHDCDPVSVSLS